MSGCMSPSCIICSSSMMISVSMIVCRSVQMCNAMSTVISNKNESTNFWLKHALKEKLTHFRVIWFDSFFFVRKRVNVYKVECLIFNFIVHNKHSSNNKSLWKLNIFKTVLYSLEVEFWVSQFNVTCKNGFSFKKKKINKYRIRKREFKNELSKKIVHIQVNKCETFISIKIVCNKSQQNTNVHNSVSKVTLLWRSDEWSARFRQGVLGTTLWKTSHFYMQYNHYSSLTLPEN